MLKAFTENSRQSAVLLPLAYSKASRVMKVPNTKGHTSNLLGKCPLYGGNATGRLISWEIHYRPLHTVYKLSHKAVYIASVYVQPCYKLCESLRKLNVRHKVSRTACALPLAHLSIYFMIWEPLQPLS